jgi:hypothetical protein
MGITRLIAEHPQIIETDRPEQPACDRSFACAFRDGDVGRIAQKRKVRLMSGRSSMGIREPAPRRLRRPNVGSCRSFDTIVPTGHKAGILKYLQELWYSAC